MIAKVLTLWQPWATLVVIGAKRIETRSWYMAHRGELLIHAAQAYPDRGLRFEEPFMSALLAAGVKPDMPLVTGAIVGRCNVIDCREIVENRTQLENWMRPAMLPPDEAERSFGDYRAGRFATLLADAEAFRVPIPARGYQRLWNYEGAL